MLLGIKHDEDKIENNVENKVEAYLMASPSPAGPIDCPADLKRGHCTKRHGLKGPLLHL